MEMNIDLVYLWVDGNDPKWLEKKNRFIEKKINTVGRYQDNQELKYSLRSIEKHLPWIRKIFIVTDDQTPIFLKPNHPKIEIVHHSEIIPKKFLPNFNSRVIEYFMYKIPDLSEKFLYANDDMFVNADLKPSFFFENGIPIMRMKYYPYLKYEIQWILYVAFLLMFANVQVTTRAVFSSCPAVYLFILRNSLGGETWWNIYAGGYFLIGMIILPTICCWVAKEAGRNP